MGLWGPQPASRRGDLDRRLPPCPPSSGRPPKVLPILRVEEQRPEVLRPGGRRAEELRVRDATHPAGARGERYQPPAELGQGCRAPGGAAAGRTKRRAGARAGTTPGGGPPPTWPSVGSGIPRAGGRAARR